MIEANSGETGLATAETRHPAAIFLDLIMNDMQGEETLKRLKSNPITADIPVIIHTSKSLQPGERAALLQDAVAIVSKDSTSRQESLDAIQEALTLAGLTTSPARREV